MTGFIPSPGQTLLVPSGPTGLHLFILILGPVILDGYGPNAQILMVNVTSIRSGIPHDPVCELHPGEHPFIQHPNYVAYRHLRLDGSRHVEQMIKSRLWMPHLACTPELLRRVIEGLCHSRLAAREFKLLLGCP